LSAEVGISFVISDDIKLNKQTLKEALKVVEQATSNNLSQNAIID